MKKINKINHLHKILKTADFSLYNLQKNDIENCIEFHDQMQKTNKQEYHVIDDDDFFFNFYENRIDKNVAVIFENNTTHIYLTKKTYQHIIFS